MFSLESPQLGDSNKYTRYTIFNKEKKIILNYRKSAALGFPQGTQERVRNSRGKRAISVGAIECLLKVGLDKKLRMPLRSIPNQVLNHLLHHQQFWHTLESKVSQHSRPSMARKPVARLPWLFGTRS